MTNSYNIFLKSMGKKNRSEKKKQSTKKTFQGVKFSKKNKILPRFKQHWNPRQQLIFILCILSSFFPSFKFLFSSVVQKVA